MKASQVIKQANLALISKTLYVNGPFGAPLTDKMKDRVCNGKNAYNKAHEKQIRAASADTFAFDCCGLWKGILWGWDAETDRIYGGAEYKKDGIPDANANGLLKQCTGVSDDFSKILPGAYLWNDGHCGIYIGNGFAIECTASWETKVIQTAVLNIGPKSGYHGRTWTKYGYLPWVELDIKPSETYTPSGTVTCPCCGVTFTIYTK